MVNPFTLILPRFCCQRADQHGESPTFLEACQQRNRLFPNGCKFCSSEGYTITVWLRLSIQSFQVYQYVGVVEWKGQKKGKTRVPSIYLFDNSTKHQQIFRRYFSLAMVTKMVTTWCTDILQISLFSLSLVMLTKLKLEKRTQATVLQKKKKKKLKEDI